MTPEELEVVALAAVARDRAQRWGYTTTLGDGLAHFLAEQVTDVNAIADVRAVLSVLQDKDLLLTPVKEKVIRLAEEWRDASLFEPGGSIGERLSRLDEAAPALQAAVDELRTVTSACPEEQ